MLTDIEGIIFVNISVISRNAEVLSKFVHCSVDKLYAACVCVKGGPKLASKHNSGNQTSGTVRGKMAAGRHFPGRHLYQSQLSYLLQTR